MSNLNAFYSDASVFAPKVEFALINLEPVAIGTLDPPILQSNCGIAVGAEAGYYAQGECAIAIGERAGYTTQGDFAIHTNGIARPAFELRGRWQAREFARVLHIHRKNRLFTHCFCFWNHGVSGRVVAHV